MNAAPPRACYRCQHWSTQTFRPHKDGYQEALCNEAKDSRDWRYTRGSDHCSKWAVKSGPRIPDDYDVYF